MLYIVFLIDDLRHLSMIHTPQKYPEVGTFGASRELKK